MLSLVSLPKEERDGILSLPKHFFIIISFCAINIFLWLQILKPNQNHGIPEISQSKRLALSLCLQPSPIFKSRVFCHPSSPQFLFLRFQI